ncbi:MAG TPA: hypothetical protein PLF67_04280, partial [Sphaerochaeta sp.]|nr:hypothetical protein [Sphaerochaeta sp.]
RRNGDLLGRSQRPADPARNGSLRSDITSPTSAGNLSSCSSSNLYAGFVGALLSQSMICSSGNSYLDSNICFVCTFTGPGGESPDHVLPEDHRQNDRQSHNHDYGGHH